MIAASDFLTAKILGAVNSAWWGVRQPICSVPQAVNLLGTASTRMIAIAQCMASLHNHVRLPKPVLESYWRTSLTKAMAASLFVEQADGDCAAEAFVSAVIQDMAMPVMHEIHPEPYDQTRRQAPVASAELCRQEQEVFGMDHGHAGSLLARSVGLPEFMSDCVQEHHNRRALGERSRSLELANALHLAALFPHAGLAWHHNDMDEAGALVHRNFDRTWSLAAVVTTVQQRCDETASIIFQADRPKIAMRALLAKGSVALASATMDTVVELRSANAQEPASGAEAKTDLALLDEPTGAGAPAEAVSEAKVKEAGDACLQALRDSGSAVAILLADMDILTTVVDEPDPDQADRALDCVRHMLEVTLGRAALVAPYGKQRLLVIAGGYADAKHLEWTASRLCEQLSAQPLSLAAGNTRVSLTIGGQLHQTIPDTADLAELVAQAEAVLKQVKSYGKGFAAVQAVEDDSAPADDKSQ